ncbi:MAG: 50S ribosomal protein L5 [Candidatus Algichlamydia australiensis]|nr:50S ribosomal protein L5 [Chlamydiales bacterium]
MAESRIKKKYNEEVKTKLQEKFGYKNPMLIPKLKKIVISMGVAEASKDKNAMQQIEKELALLSGQIPIKRVAKKSVANFKLREGQVIGFKLTLRGNRMWDFFDRFTNIVSPRIRDFRGFPRKCDGSGNYSLGIDDQQVFPELNLDDVVKVQGMNITFVTSSSTDDECRELLTHLGMPYKKAS